MRCNYCNSVLEILRPQLGDQEAICRCIRCHRLIELDSQPSNSEQPAQFPVILSRPVDWLALN